MDVVILSLIILSGVGLLCGITLAITSRFFAVKVDPRIEVLENILPGVNCGGCGFPSCRTYAQNMVEGDTEPNRCVLSRADRIDKISKVLGKEVAVPETRIAAIKCYGGNSAVKDFNYAGIPSCNALALYGGGDNLCKYSCLGFGDCVEACPFDALFRVGRKVPSVNRDKCTGCGSCTNVCPKALIILIPRETGIHLACNSKDKGKLVRQICEVGCISCGSCIKACPEDALSMKNSRIYIDYNKCTNCRQCIEECPRKIIKDINPQEGTTKVVNQ